MILTDRTTIMIAHRLRTICNADQIYVLENGQVIQQGNHETLMSYEGKYRQMVEAQNIETISKQDKNYDDKEDDTEICM